MKMLLNIGVLTCLLLGFLVAEVNFNPSLIFLTNLAAADLVHAIVLCLCVRLYR